LRSEMDALVAQRRTGALAHLRKSRLPAGREKAAARSDIKDDGLLRGAVMPLVCGAFPVLLASKTGLAGDKPGP